jgi:hypothetical protein
MLVYQVVAEPLSEVRRVGRVHPRVRVLHAGHFADGCPWRSRRRGTKGTVFKSAQTKCLKDSQHFFAPSPFSYINVQQVFSLVLPTCGETVAKGRVSDQIFDTCDVTCTYVVVDNDQQK